MAGCPVHPEHSFMAMYETEVSYAIDTDDIDVFLEPLLEDMGKLWNEGKVVWDEFKQECFTLHAMIFVAITDYPGGFSLSG